MEFDYKVEDMEKQYNAPKGFFESEVCVVDNEIANNIAPDWDYTKAEVICTGFLHGNQIKVFVAESKDDMKFKKAVKDYLNRMKLNYELVAFNHNMEEGNFKGNMDYEIKIGEVKPFMAKGWNKDRFYNILLEKEVIPEVLIVDVFNGNAGLCIDYFKKWEETESRQFLMDIVSHNINCLLKESVIYKNISYFRENYEVKANGWLKE